MFVLFSTLLYMVGVALLFVLAGDLEQGGKPGDSEAAVGMTIGFLLLLLLYLALFIPTLAVKVRRPRSRPRSRRRAPDPGRVTGYSPPAAPHSIGTTWLIVLSSCEADMLKGGAKLSRMSEPSQETSGVGATRGWVRKRR